MDKSPLQEIFLKEIVDGMRASRQRIINTLNELKLDAEQIQKLDEEIWSEIKGLSHGILVSIDGGSAMADDGLVSLIDEEGMAFDRYLHELLFDHLNDNELGS